MNKQEFQQSIKDMKPTNYINSINSITAHEAYNEGFEEAKQNVLFGSDFLDEPERPVVPQFVAEYIEYCKHEKFYALHGAYDSMDYRLKCWRFKGNNSELFAKAWLYGYEVEKEPLYFVEIPNPNTKDVYNYFLKKDSSTGKVVLFKKSVNPRNNKDLWLTESEIKEDFEWAWQFAKEVEE